MGLPARRRVVQRYQVPTTPIRWTAKVERRSGGTKIMELEAAVIEVSITGLAIVTPETGPVSIGSRSTIEWQGLSAEVIVRRGVTYPLLDSLTMYGVEFVTSPCALSNALYDTLAVDRLHPVNDGARRA